MPSAVKNTFWRVTLIYITSLVIIGLAVPYDDVRLYDGSGADISPFVIVLDKAGIPGINHLINATICVAVLSIGLSCVYAGSRTLTALAETGYAPRIFAYIDKAGRPLWSTIAICIFIPIAYVNVADVGSTVFDWLLALSGLSTLFTWLSICVTHIRFRKAWKVQGHSLEELPFLALGGVWGSWLGAILIVLVLIAQFYVAVWPLGEQPTGKAAAEAFFSKSAVPHHPQPRPRPR
jgi:amino acid transporter